MEEEKILIIEDDYKIRESLEEFLELKGYKVTTASDGEEGIKKAKQDYPHLIISDIMMPIADGYEVYKTLQDDFRTATIPFIFLTAKINNSDIRMGMGLGVSDYICKPFNPTELLKVVQVRIQQGKIALKGMEKLKHSLVLSLPHEFFTPLTVVLGTVQMLRLTEKKNLTKGIEEGLASIEHSAFRLQNLIDRYIFFSRLEIAKYNKEYSKTLQQDSLISIQSIQQVVEKQASKHERESDLVFECENFPIGIPEEHMRRVMDELLDNAFKFSKSVSNTSVEVRGSFIEDLSMSGKKLYSLKIVDYGRGMKEEDIEKYSSFLQFDREKYEQQGMGIGIAIAKGILEMYGASLEIRSILEKGTTIELKLPIADISENELFI